MDSAEFDLNVYLNSLENIEAAHEAKLATQREELGDEVLKEMAAIIGTELSWPELLADLLSEDDLLSHMLVHIENTNAGDKESALETLTNLQQLLRCYRLKVAAQRLKENEGLIPDRCAPMIFSAESALNIRKAITKLERKLLYV